MTNSNLMMLNCDVCGAVASVGIRSGPYEGPYNQETVRVATHEYHQCESCGASYLSPSQASALSRAVRDAAREQLGVLSAERIVQIRTRLGLSQAELEGLLGLGAKVVTRWESGRVVPGRAADRLLRVLEQEPSVLDVLRRVGGAAGASAT